MNRHYLYINCMVYFNDFRTTTLQIIPTHQPPLDLERKLFKTRHYVHIICKIFWHSIVRNTKISAVNCNEFLISLFEAL